MDLKFAQLFGEGRFSSLLSCVSCSSAMDSIRSGRRKWYRLRNRFINPGSRAMEEHVPRRSTVSIIRSRASGSTWASYVRRILRTVKAGRPKTVRFRWYTCSCTSSTKRHAANLVISSRESTLTLLGADSAACNKRRRPAAYRTASAERDVPFGGCAATYCSTSSATKAAFSLDMVPLHWAAPSLQVAVEL